jgi:hypothetical protein
MPPMYTQDINHESNIPLLDLKSTFTFHWQSYRRFFHPWDVTHNNMTVEYTIEPRAIITSRFLSLYDQLSHESTLFHFSVDTGITLS